MSTLTRLIIKRHKHHQCFYFCTQQSLRGPPKPIRSDKVHTGSPTLNAPRSHNLVLQNYLKSASMKPNEASSSSPSYLLSQSMIKLKEIYGEISFSSKLLFGSFIFFILFGDYLDRQYIEYSNPNGLYSFIQDSPEDVVMREARTGDVLVFQRPLFSFNPLNILRTSFRQFACGGPHDHCGVIIHNKYDNYLPYILEINQNYRNKLKLTPFDERILTAREPTIFIRQLHKTNIKYSQIADKLSDWIDDKMNGSDPSIHNKDVCEISINFYIVYHLISIYIIYRI